MSYRTLISLALLAAGASSAIGQSAPTNPTAPCPSIAEQTAALETKKRTGVEPPAAQPAERSAILPSAPGKDPSAASTVQQDGKALPSPLDCPLAPGHPNALKKKG
jgi:hypothetical protein